MFVWFIGYKVITLPPDTSNGEETTETTAANGTTEQTTGVRTRYLTYGIIVNKC